MTPSHAPVRVWDLPTRLFHWALAACVIVSVVSAKAGAMTLHFRFGYAVFALLAFRILWGLVGGRWSRFGSFLYGPGALLRYLRGAPAAGERPDVGHNPLGALSVFALLAVLAVQVGTGLVGDDEIANVGPLNVFVSTDTGLAATSWHRSWGQWLLLGLVGLHLCAIAFYTWRGQGLVAAMVGGDKDLPPDTPASADDGRTRALALALLAVCALGVWAVVSAGG
jgi:cytochrome b